MACYCETQKLSPPRPSYSSVAAFPGPPSAVAAVPNVSKPIHKIFVYLKEGVTVNTSDETKRILTGINPVSLKIKPGRVINIKNRAVLIESSDSNTKNLLDNNELADAGLEARLPEKVWPRVIVYNVAMACSEDDLLSGIPENVSSETDVRKDGTAPYSELVPVIGILRTGPLRFILNLEKYWFQQTECTLGGLPVRCVTMCGSPDIFIAKDSDMWQNTANLCLLVATVYLPLILHLVARPKTIRPYISVHIVYALLEKLNRNFGLVNR